MKKYKTWIMAGIFILGTAAGVKGTPEDERRLYDVRNRSRIPLSDAVGVLKQFRVILVGEHHNNADHHAMQLHVIRALDAAGLQPAIGMEMFRRDSQAVLDRWIAGGMPETAFLRVYYANWNFGWPLYAPILRYARDRKIPVVGLNVSREITGQVARKGFRSLSETQRGKLDMVTCRVDQTYMNFIKQAYGAHAHGDMDFTYFCEAQLVWDNVMAITAIDYLTAHPEAVMVILAGNGHAWKGGIPAQIRKRGDFPCAVILPEIEGATEPGMIDTDDADFIFLKD